MSIGDAVIVIVAVLVVACVCGPALQPCSVTWFIPSFVPCRLGGRWNRLWLLGVPAAGLLPPLQDLISPYVAMAILAVPLFLMLRSWSRTGYSPLPVA